MEEFILKFNEISINDIGIVGGKNASLGEMYNNLASKGLNVPNGFAVTVSAFKYFLKFNALDLTLPKIIEELDTVNFTNLKEIGAKLRKLILEAKIPRELEIAIVQSYLQLGNNEEIAVAVRSSATAEDLVNASFAGQHETYLNIKGAVPLIYAVKCCFASMYTDRAIKYRQDNGFGHIQVFLSVGIQQMVRSDLGCSGIGFTLEPESGFGDVIHLAGTWGLGETIVQGEIIPDEFLIFKPSLIKNKKAVLQKNLGTKSKMMVYNENSTGTNSTTTLTTARELRDKFVLEDNEIEQIARWALILEEHYNKPMDFEWAKDGTNNQIYIIQARPITVNSNSKQSGLTTYELTSRSKIITSGQAVGRKIIIGHAKVLNSPLEIDKLLPGDILVTDNTSPDWDPIMKIAGAIITNKGGRTSHASIVAREIGTPAIVGTGNATALIKTGDQITVSCAEGKKGFVYKGSLKYKKQTVSFSDIQLPKKPKAQLIISEPDRAFELSFYPNDGVGLLRIEFIITNTVKVHPMALLYPDKVLDTNQILAIEKLTKSYPNKKSYFIDKLSQGIATIAAAFYPKEVIVRMSDFKSNEYAGLLGGSYFEPKEENPMLGFRGASRYYHDGYREGFELECEAIKVVRDEMGLTNIKVMIPFCRTPEEGKKVIAVMAGFGLVQGLNNLEIFVMAEIPSNILLAEEFAEIFDGFSIGSNDLTQLTLGIDRDSSLISELFDEENPASEQLILKMIKTAVKMHKKIGICGQACSDEPNFTKFVVKAGINTIAFNPDSLFNGITSINLASL